MMSKIGGNDKQDVSGSFIFTRALANNSFLQKFVKSHALACKSIKASLEEHREETMKNRMKSTSPYYNSSARPHTNGVSAASEIEWYSGMSDSYQQPSIAGKKKKKSKKSLIRASREDDEKDTDWFQDSESLPPPTTSSSSTTTTSSLIDDIRQNYNRSKYSSSCAASDDTSSSGDGASSHRLSSSSSSAMMIRNIGGGGGDDNNSISAFAELKVVKPSHNLLNRGSYCVTNDKLKAFVEQYVADIVIDRLSMFCAHSIPSQRRGQHSISEIGFDQAFPLFFDLDLVFGLLPGAADQCVIGILVRVIQEAVRLCFSEIPDDQWIDKFGEVYVDQTLGRPLSASVIEQFSTPLQSAIKSQPPSTSVPTPVDDDEDGGGPARGRKLSAIAGSKKRGRPAANNNMNSATSTSSFKCGSNNNDFCDNDDITEYSSSKGFNNKSPLSAKDSILIDMNEEISMSSTLSLFPSSSIIAKQSSNIFGNGDNDNYDEHLDSSPKFNSSSAAAAASDAGNNNTHTTPKKTAPYIVREQGFMPKESHQDSLKLMSVPISERNYHKLGIHIHFKNLIVDSDLASKIRLFVLLIVVPYFALNRYLLERSSMLVTKCDGAYTTAEDLTASTHYNMWDQIIDANVYGAMPHCRMTYSYKTRQNCMKCGCVPPQQNNGNNNNNNTASKYSKSGNNNKNFKDNGNQQQQQRFAPNDNSCTMCLGSGITSEGPSSLSDLIYALDGAGKRLNKNNRDLSPLEETDGHASKNPQFYAYLTQDEMFNFGQYQMQPTQRRKILMKVQPRYSKSVYDDIGSKLKQSPIKFMNANIDTIPRPLVRFAKWPDSNGFRVYFKWVVTNTMIRLECVEKTEFYKPSTWEQFRTKGYSPPSLSKLGGPPESFGTTMAVILSAPTGSTAKQLNASRAVGAAAGEIDISTPKSYTIYNILVNNQLESELCSFLRSLTIDDNNITGMNSFDRKNAAPPSQKWSSLSFEPFRKLNSVIRRTPREDVKHTAAEIDALLYEGVCIVAICAGINSNFCSIQGRLHKSKHVKFRITPTHVFQTCESVSLRTRLPNDQRCINSYGHKLWPLPRNIADRLFPSPSSDSKSLSSKSSLRGKKSGSSINADMVVAGSQRSGKK